MKKEGAEALRAMMTSHRGREVFGHLSIGDRCHRLTRGAMIADRVCKPLFGGREGGRFQALP
jgi:hypothetical protein